MDRSLRLGLGFRVTIRTPNTVADGELSQQQHYIVTIFFAIP